ncbi:MAG: TRAP-type transport system, small permease component [Pseudomonadota bacterium]|jgi:TRAP-type mannitol/chloroaromatic compound transport system permease small subunit
MDESPVWRGFSALVRLFTLASGWWLIALSVATCVEMVVRKLFGFSLQGVDEVGAYTLAVISALGFPYALLMRGHTRVDFLLSRLPAWLQATLNTLAMVSLAAVAVFAAWRAWAVLAESIEFDSHSTSPLQTPLWLPQSLWFCGWLLFAIAASAMSMHACWLLGRDRERLNRAYGPPTLDEEIEAETGGIRLGGDVRAEAAR